MTAFIEAGRSTPLTDLRERCEKLLVECEDHAESPEVLRRLQLCIENFVHALPESEPTIDRMAKGLLALSKAIEKRQISMNIDLSDVLLLSLDRLELTARDGVARLPMHLMMENLRAGELLEVLAQADVASQTQWVTVLKQLLAPDLSTDGVTAPHSLVSILSVLQEYGIEANADLLFFITLTPPAEARLRRWNGRHERLLRLGLRMNRLANNPVDPQQLAAALLIHDLSMAFMPMALLEGYQSLRRVDESRIHRHVDISSALLKNLPDWQPARRMIEQHHEWVSGDGYPIGLREEQIEPGAMIIAIADAFEAITHPPRFNEEQRRPSLRAIREINRLGGEQFSRYWVPIFNEALAQIQLENPDRSGREYQDMAGFTG